jgi:hypothetical protein
VGTLRFLSDAWIDALDLALRKAPLRATGSLIVEQVVHDVPERGTVRYQVALDDAGARIEHDARADVRITTDFATAKAIARGTTNAQTALAAGRLRIGGRMEVLTQQAEALASFADVAAQLRSDTAFESP